MCYLQEVDIGIFSIRNDREHIYIVDLSAHYSRFVLVVLQTLQLELNLMSFFKAQCRSMLLHFFFKISNHFLEIPLEYFFDLLYIVIIFLFTLQALARSLTVLDMILQANLEFALINILL